MDHLRIEDENLVERYLMGQLTAEEAADFEAHYVDCPECLEKLELGGILHRGLKEVAAEEGTRTPTPEGKRGVLAWRPRARPGGPLGWALAAGLLAAVVLPWALLAPAVVRERGENARLAGELALALAPQGGTAVVALSPERAGPAAEPSTRLTLGEAPEWVVLALEPPPAPADGEPARYRVRLLEPAGKVLWQSGTLDPDAAGRVTVTVHSTWLAGPVYVLALARLDGEGQLRPAARYALRVERRR